MTEKYRVCPKCGNKITEEDFLPMGSNSTFSVRGRSPICLQCMLQDIDREDLNTINKLCQFLDVPFDTNRWIEMNAKYDDIKLLRSEAHV